ncbi:DUF937 domain-containing protein [Bradyrhizobium sp.]|jgi:hypothetical protein|uniref:DUF937 domain-containing protein n=1 Tax=Bradyrhizobium sp. TaxID=376 RepID=UPI002CF6E3DB|nr:DUF937 domain-containing protein [Bradyrhizobium sp.]HWX60693.1 DUF937 domain-containing protein [Bradyrhizobium sp.]
MAANLTSVVMQFLTPEVIEQIASFLRIDKAATQKAAGGAVPSLLAGLADLVETSAGSGQLSKLLSQQQAGSPLDLLRNAGPEGLAASGSNMMSALFGGRAMDAMAQAIGKFAGIGDGTGKSLLGMLGPIVLGALGQQQRLAGFDANGLASLLRSQKDQFVKAIPSGLADQLGASGLIDRFAGASGRASTAASQTISPTYSSAAAQWPYWLAAVVVVAGLAWFATNRNSEQSVAETPTATRPAPGTVGMAPATMTVDGVNLANNFNSSVNTLKSTLPGITDPATAQSALPKINEVTAQLNDINGRAAKLSPEARSALVKLIVVAIPSINQMCDKIIATPEVGPVAKPAIDDLRAKLDALARV